MAAQAGVVVQVLMRGRGGTTRARARGIGERRTGGETVSRWGEGVKLVQVVTMVGAGVQVAVVKSRNPEQRWQF